jgi:hypothetical protein
LFGTWWDEAYEGEGELLAGSGRSREGRQTVCTLSQRELDAPVIALSPEAKELSVVVIEERTRCNDFNGREA